MEKYYYYCSEDISLIENYDRAKADNFKGWVMHHRLETHNFDGTRRKSDLSMDDLIALDMYICRPANELIFMTVTEHRVLHMKGKSNPLCGKHHSEKSKKKMSEVKKDKRLSEEHRRRISEAEKGENNPFYGKHHSAEAKRKISEASKGRHWFTNGIENKYCFECPEGFVKGRKKGE